ncbi:DUF2092 domain-containing protein [Mongoliitalea daihaiensis]|uniref:DUF2092 domain-containing protein n=1 Tax=Mongoliitalea daihaiensis TaxID=2782006 RepID=UPI001F3498BC|nr:DUF2092 domain-containing protein [Mongoliitalea daihaiensis]UJP63813.1 DUF2092 domain-containing protein [Mongoliitalea daihaiensis]
MKKIVLTSLCYLAWLFSHLQAQQLDHQAILLLDRMSDLLGELTSFQFHVFTAQDEWIENKGLTKTFRSHEVYMVGPDKMHIRTESKQGQLGIWHQGDLLLFYNLTTNQYGFIETPENIPDAIDFVNQEYDIEFPAADFFYPAFADDLIETHQIISYMGLVQLDGKDAHHIIAYGEETNVQIWFSNDTFTLPLRYVIHDLKSPQFLQFEGIFSNWKLNPDLPNALFDFTVPETATRMHMLSKSSTYSNEN